MKIEVRGHKAVATTNGRLIRSSVVMHVDPRKIQTLSPSEFTDEDRADGEDRPIQTFVGINGGWFDAYEDCEALRLRIIDNGGIQLRHEGDSQRPSLAYTGWP